jgi:hypothetical protein
MLPGFTTVQWHLLSQRAGLRQRPMLPRLAHLRQRLLSRRADLFGHDLLRAFQHLRRHVPDDTVQYPKVRDLQSKHGYLRGLWRAGSLPAL